MVVSFVFQFPYVTQSASSRNEMNETTERQPICSHTAIQASIATHTAHRSTPSIQLALYSPIHHGAARPHGYTTKWLFTRSDLLLSLWLWALAQPRPPLLYPCQIDNDDRQPNERYRYTVLPFFRCRVNVWLSANEPHSQLKHN